MGETYYDVLEVDEGATEAEIREAYRDRVLETHPDQNDAADATVAFERVKRAQEVLTDGDERARYDRLGHEAYLELEAGVTGASRTPADAASSDRGGEGGSGTAGGASTRGDRSRGAAGAKTGATDGWWRGGAERSGPSHHARQRRRRRRATAEARVAEWFVDDERDRDGPGGVADEPAEDGDGPSAFSVDDWDGEVETGRRGLEQSTWIVVGVFTALYPAFVYSSVTPAFSPVVNVVVAACTLVLVAYLLTIPHVAVVSFGVWSLLGPIALLAVTDLSPRSIPFLGFVGAVWVPFGYAVVVRWALPR